MTFAQTKIQRPRPRAGLLLARPSLEQELVSALSTHRAVLLCAPAGYGKTAVLTRALDQLPARHAAAWISLDPGDDLHRLLESLVAALETFDPPWRSAPEGLVAAATLGGERGRRPVIDELVNTLEACDVVHGVIVLDDLHHVDDPACLEFLELLLQRLGERWTMAITARHEPALRLARFRAAGDLAELRQDRLRFTREEARALLAGGGVEADATDALYERTAGWPAGLRLALNGAPGGARGAIDRQAFDFLASEVVERIDPGLREFLLLTSVLHDLDEPRCAAITGDALAAARLEEIERLGLFATVVDDARRTLRLHDLFREALQQRLRVERPETWLAQLRSAAAVEPDLVRRQAMLLQAHQPEEAARGLLDSVGLLTQGGVRAMLRLFEQFPPGFAAASPELQMVSGVAKWALWETGQAERHFAQAEALFAARGDAGASATARGQRTITLIALGRLNEAGALIDASGAAPLEGDARRHLLLARLWHAVESGAHHAAAGHFEALLTCLEATPVIEAWFSTVPAPRVTAERGVAGALARWASGALAVVGDRPLPLRALGILSRGWHALWQGRIDEARRLLQRAEADAQWTGQHVITRSHSLAMRALVDLASGAGPSALEAMRTRIAEHTAGYGDWGLWHTLFLASRIAAASGERELLQEWLARLAALEPALPNATPARLHPLQGLRGTQAWLEGRRDDAMALWREALEHEEPLDLLGHAVEVRVRLAGALLQAGAPAHDAAALEPVLARAEDGPRGALFCGAALAALAAAEWHGRLDAPALATLRHWSAALHPASVAAVAAPAPIEVAGQRLSGREMEVLERIARGESNKLIARAFDLSPYTVKRHVANILDKLALTSRGQAAAWFHERH